MDRTFDDQLTEDQRERASRLRKQARHETTETKFDPGPTDRLPRFDDCFYYKSDLSRSQQLRKKVRAELYWEKAPEDVRLAIRDAVIAQEPFIGNETYTNHFMKRGLQDIIRDEYVLNYIIINVLALI